VESLKDRPALVEGEDFYREGAYIVFTAAYHLRRGYCCESGCRHCPYRGKPEDASGTGKKTELKDERSL
jgi:2-iminoacetate synthase ThiH